MPNLSVFQQLREAKQEPIKPVRVEVLEPTDFADTWEKRPSKSIAVGLRRLSEAQEQGAIQEATQEAVRLTKDVTDRPEYAEEFVHHFNETLIRLGVGRALCDPNNALSQSRHIELPEETLHRCLRSSAIQRLWHALEEVSVETSSLHREATDDEVADLCTSLLAGRLEGLPVAEQRRARRFLAVVFDDLALADGED